MSVTAKLLLFGAALLALFAGAAGIGRAVGPVESTPSADHGDMGEDADDASTPGWTWAMPMPRRCPRD